MTHKSEDFKISAVKYYNTYEVSMDEVCDIFGCSKTSLKRWIETYKKKKSIKRKSRKSKSYKVNALKYLKYNGLAVNVYSLEVQKEIDNKIANNIYFHRL